MIRVSRRALLAALAVLGVLAAVVGASRSGAAASVLTPTATADPKALEAQRASSERAIQRAYAAATDQLHKARQLKLAISDAQAGEIEARNLADLVSLRHSALTSLAQVYGAQGPDAERYATTTEARLDAAPVPDRTAADPVLLAPRLYSIVQRMDQLAAQIADRGTREMTAAPSVTPRPSGNP